MPDNHERDVLASLAQRKPNTPVAMAADLANDHVDSICRISLAWISGGSVHGVSYFAKPPQCEFTNRKITADMVESSSSFADVWDGEIAPLLQGAVLAAYSAEHLFTAIQSSYESGGRAFFMNDAYVRDVKFLASAYIAGLGNDSFASIMHYLKIPVDLDNSLSRAMACSCCIRSLEQLYPIENYGIPLSAIMAGALRRTPVSAEKPHDDEARRKKYLALARFTQLWLLPFLILCLLLTAYYIHRREEQERSNVDFSRYAAAEKTLPGALSGRNHPSMADDFLGLMPPSPCLMFNAESSPAFLSVPAVHDVKERNV